MNSKKDTVGTFTNYSNFEQAIWHKGFDLSLLGLIFDAAIININ